MKGHNIGYVRVSSAEQNSARQLAGISLDKIFEDNVSGKDTNRPQLNLCLEFLREGDTLHIHSMDRLARNLQDLLALVKTLTQRGIGVRFHNEQLIFTGEHNPIQNLQLSIMGAVAEFERSLIHERQKEGIAAALKRGVKFGRNPKLSAPEITTIVSRARGGENKSLLAKEYSISRETLYKYLKTSI